MLIFYVIDRMDNYLVPYHPRTSINDCSRMVYDYLDNWPLDTLCSDATRWSTYQYKL